MKAFLFMRRKDRARGGFSLVEASLSLGLMSFGFLTLAPLLALGLKTASHARADRTSAQIAQTLIQEGQQGTLTTGTAYLDLNGAPCSASQAAYTTQSTLVPVTGSVSLVRLQVRITPVGAPDRVRTYAAVFPPTP